MDKVNKKQTGNAPARLEELLALGLKVHDSWSEQELEAALLEQISTPMEFQLHTLDHTQAKALHAQTAARNLLLKNLHDLLQHTHPPIPLLVLAKDYFKSNHVHPTLGMPAEVARCLYYFVVAVARLRHRARISSLSDLELLQGLEWIHKQVWISGELKKLAAEATAAITDDLQHKTGTG